MHIETPVSEMLQWYFILFFSRDHVLTRTYCKILDSYLYTVIIAILGEKLLPSHTLNRILVFERNFGRLQNSRMFSELWRTRTKGLQRA